MYVTGGGTHMPPYTCRGQGQPAEVSFFYNLGLIHQTQAGSKSRSPLVLFLALMLILQSTTS